MNDDLYIKLNGSLFSCIGTNKRGGKVLFSCVKVTFYFVHLFSIFSAVISLSSASYSPLDGIAKFL